MLSTMAARQPVWLERIVGIAIALIITLSSGIESRDEVISGRIQWTPHVETQAVRSAPDA